MEEKLLKIFKLADILNEKQDKVYAEVEYTANDRKKLVISLIAKKEFTYVERFEVELKNNFLINWDCIVQLFENYINGCDINE